MTEFTPAAERALRIANQWASLEPPSELASPEILLGLLASPSAVRAAGASGIWHRSTSGDRSLAATALVAGLDGRHFCTSQFLRHRSPPLCVRPRPGCSNIRGPCSWLPSIYCWDLWPFLVTWRFSLRERGLAADSLEARVHQFAGHQPGPLAWEDDPGIEPAGLPRSAEPGVDDDSDEAVMAREPVHMPELEDPTPIQRRLRIQGHRLYPRATKPRFCALSMPRRIAPARACAFWKITSALSSMIAI